MKNKAASSEIESNGKFYVMYWIDAVDIAVWMVDDEVMVYGVKYNFQIRIDFFDSFYLL